MIVFPKVEKILNKSGISQISIFWSLENVGLGCWLLSEKVEIGQTVRK